MIGMHAVERHYELLLSKHYTWMFGKQRSRIVAEQASLLTAAGVIAPGTCIDLGCGPGFQTLALLQLGATRIHAIDSSAELLQELSPFADDKKINIHNADLTTFGAIIEQPVDTIVCMGDTLPHLSSRDDVSALFSMIATRLRPTGRVAISWRDLSSPPQGLDRFIPIQADDQRIMVCYLEDRGDTVCVHDLIHVRSDTGWTLHKGAYPKLKLSTNWVKAALRQAGLHVEYEDTKAGMTMLAAIR